MRRITIRHGLVLALISMHVAAVELPLERISLPPGFSIEL